MTTSGRPDVTIVIVNHDGREHLGACLDSIAALEYPGERFDVLVIDNGSTDGSLDVLRSHPLDVTIVELDDNVGFAPAVNLGARTASSECIALLNNDMHVLPGWLDGLVAAYRPEQGVTCVGGAILDWNGEHVDFAGPAANFHGFGDQPGFGRAVGESELVSRDDVLFACGGSMLVHRERFVEAGGFDETYFAYFEDVDFGWRLNVLGDRVAFSADSICCHRHHGTSHRLTEYQKLHLLERNALRTVYKNVGDDQFGRRLAAALLLLHARVIDDARMDPRPFAPFSRTRPRTDIGAASAARLQAVRDVLDDLSALDATRRDIQARRAVEDTVLAARFESFDTPIGATSDDYRAVFDVVRSVVLDGVPAGSTTASLGRSKGRVRDAVHRSPSAGRLRRLRRRLSGGA